MTSVLLYSGGLDSYIARFLFKPDVCLYVDIHGQYSKEERIKLPQDVIIVDFPGLKQFERKDLIIPLRNLFFCCIGTMYGDRVMMAATKGDRVLDKSIPFADKASDLLSYLWRPQHWTNGKEIKIELPTKEYTKTDLIRMYLEKGGDPIKLVEESFSCYQPINYNRCGSCKACYRNWVACTINGITMTPSSRNYIESEILPIIKSGMYGRGDEEKEIIQALQMTETNND